MNGAPNDWMALTLLVFTLGMRHGVDADHLVAIDGLTRFNAANNPPLARWCGALFSLGHGLVVMLVALLVGGLTTAFTPPRVLQDIGAWISIGFLLILGMLNLVAIAMTSRDEPVRLVGAKAFITRRLQRTIHPVSVAAVGSVFALSFDTVTQAALFAATGTQFGGVPDALILGLFFTIGMLLVDGLNGIWIFRLVLKANRRALIASRVFAAVVASLSFCVAALGIARYFSLSVNQWTQGAESGLGLVVVLLVLLGFRLAMRLSRVKAAD